MTALPLRDFTAAEQNKLAAIEAAPAAEESVRERLIRATHAAACGCGDEDPSWSTYWQQIADAAIAVLRGPSSDAEQAVERCLALADELEAESRDAMKRSDDARARNDRVMYPVNVRHARVAKHTASAIRTALAGD